MPTTCDPRRNELAAAVFPAVRRFAFSRTTAARAEDVAHDSMVRILKLLDRDGVDAIEKPAAWAVGVTRNVLMNVGRRRRVSLFSDLRAADDQPFDPAERVADEPDAPPADLVREILATIDTLPAADRRLVHLRFAVGLSCVEVAAKLLLTPEQVSRRVARVVAALREAIGGSR